MIELLHWFQTNYPQYKKALLECHHNFDDNDTNPYHVEGDCWSHTMMVCKIAELKGYSRVVQVSALLHDIGKPQSRKINPQNNHVQFFGHEEISAQLAQPLLDDLVTRGLLEKNEVKESLELIASHAFLYRKNEEELLELFRGRAEFFEHLMQLAECDDFGRFSKNMGKYDINREKILENIKNSFK